MADRGCCANCCVCVRPALPALAVGVAGVFGAMMPSPWLHGAICGALAGGAIAYMLLVHDRKRRRAYFARMPRCESVVTPLASPAAGHYSQAIKNGGLVYVSGLLPITPDGTKLADKPFSEQAERVLGNLEAILTAAGTSVNKLVSVRVYITDISNWAEFNALYSAKLGVHKPARCVVPVPELHYGFLLEVEAIASLRSE